MKVKIVNWDSHQERPDRANYQWFKFYNGFWTDTKIFQLNWKGKILFVYLLSLASHASKSVVDFSEAHASHMIGLKADWEKQLLQMSLLGLIEVDGNFQESDGLVSKKVSNNTFDLEQVYQLYPKRTGQRKAFGLGRLARDVKTPEDFAACQRAAANYAKYCEAECKEERFIKQFGTWSGEWREWVTIDPPLLKEGDWHG